MISRMIGGSGFHQEHLSPVFTGEWFERLKVSGTEEMEQEVLTQADEDAPQPPTPSFGAFFPSRSLPDRPK